MIELQIKDIYGFLQNFTLTSYLLKTAPMVANTWPQTNPKDSDIVTTIVQQAVAMKMLELWPLKGVNSNTDYSCQNSPLTPSASKS